MPSWDPFGIEQLHAKLREEIGGKVEGRAKSDISGTMVSLIVKDDGQPKFYHIGVDGMRHHDVMQEMIVDVASGEGMATARTFRKSFVDWMIDDRRAYPKAAWPKKHAEAERLRMLVEERRDLFV